MTRQRVHRGIIFQQLTERHLDAELLAERPRDLREKQRIETQFEETSRSLRAAIGPDRRGFSVRREFCRRCCLSRGRRGACGSGFGWHMACESSLSRIGCSAALQWLRRRFDPVSLSLEWVSRQRHPPAAVRRRGSRSNPPSRLPTTSGPARSAPLRSRRALLQAWKARSTLPPRRRRMLARQRRERLPGANFQQHAVRVAVAAVRPRRRQNAPPRADASPSSAGRWPAASVIQRPVTLETNGIGGACSGTDLHQLRERFAPPRPSSRNGTRARSSTAAPTTWRSSRTSSRTRRPPPSFPDTTQSAGALTAATDNASPCSASSGASSASGSRTASITPPGCACTSRARSRHQPERVFQRKYPREARRDVFADAVPEHRAPAARPNSSSSLASAYPKTNNAGCVKRVWSNSPRFPRLRVKASSRRSTPSRCGRNSSAQRSISSRKTGSLRYSPAPMSDRLRPLARKQERHGRLASRGRRLNTRLASRRSSAPAASARSRATTIRRQANARRPACKRVAHVRRVERRRARADAARDWPSPRPARFRSAPKARRAAASRAPCSDAGSTAGASSKTACALVPPTPKELTPARRGVPSAPAGHSSNRVLT